MRARKYRASCKATARELTFAKREYRETNCFFIRSNILIDSIRFWMNYSFREECLFRYIYVCICICACVLCVYMYNNFRFHLVPLICYFAIYTNRQMENLASTRGVEIKTSCRIKKETAFVLYSVLGVRRPFS